MINTTPTGSHTTFEDYGNFLIRRFIIPQWVKGAIEVHIIFDNPGRLGETPKYFERYRRDCTAQVMTGHLCDEVNGNTIIPKPWRANFINCRNCKRSLVIFITKHLLKFASQFMHDGQMLVLAGGFDGDIEDTA